MINLKVFGRKQQRFNQALFRHFPGETEEIHEKPQSR
jgi:hypothetical protein